MNKILKKICLIVGIILLGVLYSCRQKNATISVNSLEDTTVTNIVNETNNQDEVLISPSSEEVREIYVHICGAVNHPEVYRIREDMRLFELIQLAGGLTEDAAGDYMNQASLLEDGQQVYIPTVVEVEEGNFKEELVNVESVVSDGLIDINKASKEQLMNLPGIGESKATSIISYRDDNGGFLSIEDIKNIPGIKDSVFNKIKDKIIVR